MGLKNEDNTRKEIFKPKTADIDILAIKLKTLKKVFEETDWKTLCGKEGKI